MQITTTVHAEFPECPEAWLDDGRNHVHVVMDKRPATQGVCVFILEDHFSGLGEDYQEARKYHVSLDGRERDFRWNDEREFSDAQRALMDGPIAEAIARLAAL